MRIVAFIALALLASQSVAEPAPDTRDYWAYEGGWFAKKAGKAWIEMNDEVYSKAGKPWQFTEVERTEAHVELYDASRKVTVRLTKDKLKARADDEAEWKELYEGRWKKRKK